MKIVITSVLATLLLSGCAGDVMSQFELGTATSNIKQQGILDPDAVARNAGRVNSLDGQYGVAVMENYRTSTYRPETARTEFKQATLGGGDQ
ncbi:hypothetical protein FCL40_07395 [Ferrimonas sediminicola]|uniref:Lipoprotein n=1 Tax=Ferrimonas sediminicola TaxID=2569538 RepID=A0A4U1BIT5_9GAMM|nr:hypothetical protein [Ferrimonas sediminicola]TKB49966.1 hypothetical protein FCL40_07395 [Ferrimonas sediminicola]